MTMNTHVARAVRRTLVLLVMLIGAQSFLYEWLHADPEVPPAAVDRVRVSFGEGPPHEVVDGAAVSRIVGIVRAHRGHGARVRGTVCFFGNIVEFYNGAQRVGSMMLAGGGLVFSARDEQVVVSLGEGEAEELRRLLGAPAE
jgi:hypothetical protein